MLKSIKIYNLYNNKKTISIEFNEKLTILTGDNGSGKTTMLNIINDILNETYEDLFKYKFTAIEILYNDKETIIFRENNRTLSIIPKKNLGYEFNLEDLEKINLKDIEGINNIIKKDEEDNEFDDYDMYNMMRKIGKYPTLYFPTYRRSEVELTELLLDSKRVKMYYNRRFNRVKNLKNTVVGINNEDLEEIVKRHWISISKIESDILNSFIGEMFLSFLKISNITDNILDEIEVEEINNKLKEIFTRTQLSKNINSIDSKINSYTDTIKKAKDVKSVVDKVLSKEDVDMKELDNMLEKLERRRFASYSLANILDVIQLYKEKCENIEKYKAPFKNLEDELNEFLSPKKVMVENGVLYFIQDANKLTFDDLSAGEKQLVAMFSYIYLAVKKNGIVMIDEIEISLHINWQRNIISKLIEKREDIQFIISTHSPSILSDYRKNGVKIKYV